MLIFGHIGVSFAIFNGGEKCLKKKLSPGYLDYRVIAVGVLLPDLIDKPLVQMLYGLNHHEGHSVAHTPWFALALFLMGVVSLLISHRDRYRWMLLGLCCWLHQLEDVVMHIKLGDQISSYFRQHGFVLNNLGPADYWLNPVAKKIPYLAGVRVYAMEPYVTLVEAFGFLYIVYFTMKNAKKIKTKLIGALHRSKNND